MGRQGSGIERATLEQLVADAGVSATAEDIDALLRSLARMQKAAAALLQSPPFDATVEQFYRLLESDAAPGTGA